ncbi:MAG: hypothetical protein E2P01_05765 [Acidobacteria bacterium]|nr:MAG: hypothetical protein E2P01_05765 [Acidobacteriota bacterium]
MFSRPTRDYPTVPSTSANGLSRKSNQRYTTARTRLAVAEAGYEAVQDASPDGIPEVLNSPLITHLRQRQAELERQFSQMSERFAPEWPPLIQEASQAAHEDESRRSSEPTTDWSRGEKLLCARFGRPYNYRACTVIFRRVSVVESIAVCSASHGELGVDR